MTKLEIKYITKSAPMLNDNKENKGAPVEFWELRGITLDLSEGEAIGLIGTNSSGKSLLLSIISGKTRQTTGFITTKNHIGLACLDELDPNISGLENIRKKITKFDIDEFKGNHLTNAVINFIEFGQWLYQPVGTYSAGMKARLVLGIALIVEPEIVLIDGVLDLLDRSFEKKVAKKIRQLKDSGVSFIIAETRNVNIERFCERTMWLQFGQIQDFGPTKEVLQQYSFAEEWYDALTLPEQNDYLANKQWEQVQFNIDKIYEEFKVEQFKHGYTRKDEPRMRKAFFVERGIDPVKAEKKVTEKQKPEVKKDKKTTIKQPKAVILSIVIILLCIIGGAFWLISGKDTDTQSSNNTVTTSKKATSTKISASKKAALKAKSSSKKAAEASSKAAKDSSKAASSSAAAASASESSKLANTQTIEVASGDSLESLASKYETTVSEIQSLNNLGSSENIKIGETLYVPK